MLAALSLVGFGVLVVVGVQWIIARGPALPAHVRVPVRRQLIDSLGPGSAFAVLLAAGVFAVMVASTILGELAALVEGVVDLPVFHAMTRVQTDLGVQSMEAVAAVTGPGPTRVVAVIAALLLAGLATERRWMPPLIVGIALVLEAYQQPMIAAAVDRELPPTEIGGYPAADCVRVILVYGTLLALTGYSGRVWWAGLAGLAYLTGCAGLYLGEQWLTDVLGGWLTGGLLLSVVVFAARALLPEHGYRATSAAR